MALSNLLRLGEGIGVLKIAYTGSLILLVVKMKVGTKAKCLRAGLDNE